MYWLGLLNNIRLIPHVMPDWTPMVFTEPGHFLTPILNELEVTTIPCENTYGNLFGTTWRLYALGLPDITHVVCRDADSVITPKDAWCVEEWVKSGKTLHRIVDFNSPFPVCTGCFGIKGGLYPDIEKQIHDFIPQYGSNYHCDEAFLKVTVWKDYQHDCLTHGQGGDPFNPEKQANLVFTGFKIHTALKDVFNWREYDPAQVYESVLYE